MVKLKKRKAKVSNAVEDELIVQNSDVTQECISPIRTKKKKIEDVMSNSDVGPSNAYVHCEERKRHVTFAPLDQVKYDDSMKNGTGRPMPFYVIRPHLNEMRKPYVIEPNFKKKRKHKDISIQDVIETGDSLKEVEEEDEVNTEIYEPPVEPFSAESFRKSLKKEQSLKSLKSFAYYLAKPIEGDAIDVATEYITAGGSAMEVLQQLETKDQDQFGVANAVFTALHALIMRSLTDIPDLRPSCEEACRYLLNAYSLTIQKMISEKASAQDIKATLKLLTGVVTISPVFARDVLANVKFPPPLLKIMTVPSRLGEMTNVRTCFVHFLMAFLVDKNTSLIRSFLEKQALLISILPGLVYDKVETAHLVLTTLRTCVVENKFISKSMKRQVFNTSTLKVLFKLYLWNGPQRGTKRMWQIEGGDNVDGLSVVIDALQPLLVLLCTSYKLGVAFLDPTLGTSSTQANTLIHSLLQEVESPWENIYKRDLVVKILVACPDLIRNRMSTIVQHLEPRASTSWLSAMTFIKEVVEAMDPEVCLRPHLRTVPRDQLPSMVQVLSAPSTLMPIIKDEMLLHSHIIVRQTTLELLVVMFRQMRRFLDALDEWGVVEPSERETFRLKATRNLPNVELLMRVWNEPPAAPVIADSVLMEVTLITHLSTLLDVMLLQNLICPTRTGGGSTLPLKPDEPPKLDIWDLLDVIEQVDDKTVVATMQVKAVHMVFEFNRDLFKQNKKVFSHSTQVLLTCLHDPEPTVSQSACSVLTTILQSTGVFDGLPIEVHIWIHCFHRLSVGVREIAAKALTQVLAKIVKKPEKYKPKAEMTVVHKKPKYGKKAKKNLVEAFKSSASQPQSSPLLEGILKHIKKKQIVYSSEVNDFLKDVVIHLSHSLTSLSSMNRLLGVEDKLGVMEYVQWSYKETDEIQIMPALVLLFGMSSVEYQLSMFILGLKSEFKSTTELFESRKASEYKTMELDDSRTNAMKDEIVDNAVHLMLLFNLTLFQTTRLVGQGKLTETSASRCADAFTTLLTLLIQHPGNLSPNNPSFDLQCIRNLFTHPILLNSFVPIAHVKTEKKGKQKPELKPKLPTEMISSLVLWITSKYPDHVRRSVLKLYKDKLVNALVHATLKKPTKAKKGDITFANVLTLFEVDYKDVVRLLGALTSTHTSYIRLMVEDSPDSLSMCGELVSFLIKHVVTLRVRDRREGSSLPPAIVTSLSSMYVKLRARESLDLSSLEESLVKYLEQFPHSQESVPHEVFVATLNTRPDCEVAARLGLLLLSRNNQLGVVFSGAVIQSSEAGKRVKNSPLIFSCCQILIEHSSPTLDRVLAIVYEDHREDIIKWIKKPHKAKPWAVVGNMIEKCMTPCAELCDYIEEHISKLSSYGIREFHILWIESVFTKHGLDTGDNDKHLLRLVKLLLELLTQATKKDKTKLDYLCKSLSKCVGRVNKVEHLEAVCTCPVWFEFTTQVLKLGLQPEDSMCDRALLLETLASLCQVVYRDASNNNEVTTLFEMTLSHSEFLGVMLGASPTKLGLVRLLATFVAKSPEVMSTKHVPILLGAYSASLSLTDQHILKLINTYEANNVSTYECRPYLWGEAAVNYYCVKTKETISLWRQPQTSQVLELLDMSKVQTTIKKFPLERKSDLGELADQPYVYDPAFFLPLFSHLLSPESVVQPYKFTHTGGIALTLASLASHSFEIRALAYHVLSRYHCHLDASRGRDRVWWLQFLDAVKQGVVDMGEEGVQLACAVTTFLARASLVISQPLDPMFDPLNKFILAKPAMNLNAIPELYILLNSTDLNSKTHRHFLLAFLRDGLRLSYDWQLAMKCALFQLLLTYYSSIISGHDDRSKVLILQVINSSMQIPGVAALFVGGYGFFSWFHQTVRELKSSNHDLIIPSIQIIISLWHSAVVSKENIRTVTINKTYAKVNVSLLLIGILSKLPPKMTLEELKKFMLILKSVLAETTMPLITEQHLSTLLQFSKGFLGPLDECEDMLEFGCKFVKKICETVDARNEVEEVKSILRQIIVLWWNHDKRSKKFGFKVVKSKAKKLAFLSRKKTGSSKAVRKASLNVKRAKEKNKIASKKLAVKKKKGTSVAARKTSLTEKKAKKKSKPDPG